MKNGFDQERGDGISANGVYLIDKPEGISSFAVVRRVRKLLGIKKVGHAGTLDPFASGLLVVCAGREATRHISFFMEGQKEYRARLQLGIETDTHDPEGTITRTRPVPDLNEQQLTACLNRYLGQQWQTPPAFSALKHKGKPLYHYARQGVFISKDPRAIEIYSLQLVAFEASAAQLDIAVQCSRGTYIRVLAHDIGNDLGCGAHLISLRRTGSGTARVANALDGKRLFSEEGKEYLLTKRHDIAHFLAMREDKTSSNLPHAG